MNLVVLGAGQIGTHLSLQRPGESFHIRLLPVRNFNMNDPKAMKILDESSHIVWAGKDVATLSKPGEASTSCFYELLTYLRFRKSMVHFTYLSSGGAIYGNPNIYPTSEFQDLNPVSPYGIGKMKHELMLQTTAEENELVKLLVMRVSNIYSFGDMDSGLISSIERAVRNELNIKILGGEQTRDYLHIADFNIIVRKFWENNVTGTYNIGSGTNYSVNEIIDIFESTYQKRLKYVQEPIGAQEVLRSELNVDKMQSLGPFKFRTFHEILLAHHKLKNSGARP